MSRRQFLGRISIVVLATTFLLFLVFLVSPQPTVYAAPTTPSLPTLQLLGHIGGEITTMQPMTNLLYAGIGADLAILDVSTPSTPTLLGAVTLGGQLSDIAIVGHYALVAGEQLGLHIVDIATPTAPQLITSTLLVSAPQHLAVYGNLAYVTYQSGAQSGLAVLDLTDPTSPILVNSKVGGIAFNPTDLQIWKQQLYVVGGSFQAIGLSFNTWGHLQVFALQNPTAPTTLAHYQTPPGPGEIFEQLVVAADLAYIVDDGTLQIFSVAQPASPVLLSSLGISFGLSGQSLQVTGPLVFVARGPMAPDLGELTIINASNPAAPQAVTKFPAITTVAAQQQRLYVAQQGVGIEIWDSSSPSQPQRLGAYINWVSAGNSTAAGNLVYLGGRKPMLATVDFTQPARPQLVATYDNATGQSLWPRFIRGNRLIALTDTGVDLFDINTSPVVQRLGHYTTTTLADVAWQDDLLYITTYNNQKNQIEIVDGSNPAVPKLTATVPLSPTDAIGNLLIMGNYALLGTRILDISTPDAPKEVATYMSAGFVWRSVLVDNRLYVLFYTADDACRGGLEIIDLSNPAAPVRLGYQCWPNYAVDLAVADGYVYVTQAEGSYDRYWVGRLVVFDGTFPHALTELAVDRRIGTGADLSVADHTVYVTSNAGLFAYRYQSPHVSTVVTGPTTLQSAADEVHYEFTTGTFTTPVTVTHTSIPADGQQAALPMFAVGSAFRNQAVSVAAQAQTQPVQPYTLQLHYMDAEIGLIDETTLALYQWVNGRWQREASSQFDAATNTITATPSTLGVWIAAGAPLHQLYLPRISK